MKYKCFICNKKYSLSNPCQHIKEIGLQKCIEHSIVEPVIDGKDLLKIRKHFNLTQTELAKKIGVTPSTVCHWEAEKRDVREWVQKVLESVFGKETLERILKEGEDDSRENNREQTKKISSVSC